MEPLSFTVHGLPPKKDGADSMWNKGVEQPRLKALRAAAVVAMAGRPPFAGPLSLKLIVHARPEEGDLDNFITGICDGLMACHSRTPIDGTSWGEVPSAAHPCRAIVFVDDKQVCRIEAERRSLQDEGPNYVLTVEDAFR